MLHPEVREYYLKRDVGGGFEEMGKILERVRKRLDDVVSFEVVRDDAEFLDGGRGNPNRYLKGVCFSGLSRIGWHVHGNDANRAINIGLRYSQASDCSDVGRIIGVLLEEGFEKAKDDSAY